MSPFVVSTIGFAYLQQLPAGSAAWAWATLTELNAGANTESIPQKINFYRFGFLVEIFVYKKLKPIRIVDLIRFFGLIQSHSKWRSASSAFV